MKTNQIFENLVDDLENKISRTRMLGKMIVNEYDENKDHDVDALYKAGVDNLLRYSKQDLIKILTTRSEIVAHALFL